MKVLIVFIHAAIVSAWSASASIVYTVQNVTRSPYRNVTKGYVVSPEFGNGTSYPEGFYGSVTLIAWPPNKYIKLYFEEVDLDVNNYCGGDSLEIWEGRYVANKLAFFVCGWYRPRPWISVDNAVKIVFRSDFMLAGRGFRIRYEATPVSGLCNSKSEYQCMNRQCIPISKKCDGVMDCTDASDEAHCPSGAVRAHASSANMVPCGTPVHRPVTEPEDRVVGGQEAVPHSWPWQVSLSRREFEVMGHFCGGSLVSPQWVLTAAHCVRRKKAKDVRVVLGMHSRLNVSDVISRGVRIAVTHPKFSKDRRNHDVALVKLDAPVDFTDSIRPICLPAKEDDLLARGQCFVTGWGQTRGSGSYDKLKQAEMTELPFKKCLSKNMGTGDPEERYTFCAGDLHGQNGICSGDSGGPLVCSKNGTSWTILGVANSAVMATEVGALCGAGSDSFWNRIAFHMPWIKRTMRAL